MEESKIETFVLKVVAVDVRNAWHYATFARCVEVGTRRRLEVYLYDDVSVKAAVYACRNRSRVVVAGRSIVDPADKYPVVDDVRVVSVRRARRSDV